MKRIQVAFAESGDKTDIPTTTQGDGSVSYPTGYGADYEKNLDSDPTAKRIERKKMNQALYDLSSNVKLFQDQTVPDFVSDSDNGGAAMSYPKGVIVAHAGLLYQSLTDNNEANITDPAHWSGIAPKNEYVSHGSYVIGDIIKGSDGKQYYCNKVNNSSSAVDPVGDNTDTWREYPYKLIVNVNGRAFKYWDGVLFMDSIGAQISQNVVYGQLNIKDITLPYSSIVEPSITLNIKNGNSPSGDVNASAESPQLDHFKFTYTRGGTGSSTIYANFLAAGKWA